MNHLTEEQLVSYHYGDAGSGQDAATVEEHVHSCASCQADLGELRHVLAAVDSLSVPQRSEGYGAEVWARIQPSLGRDAGTWGDRLRGFLSPRRLAFAGGIAVLVAAAFVAGRTLPWLPSSPAPAVSPSVGPAPAVQTASVENDLAPVPQGNVIGASPMSPSPSPGPTVSAKTNRPGAAGPRITPPPPRPPTKATATASAKAPPPGLPQTRSGQ